MSTQTPTRTAAARTPRSGPQTAYAALVGLAALGVLLQGLWAGLFLRVDGQRDAAQGWVEVHAAGGEVTIVLAALATGLAFWKLRARRDLWAGAAVLTVLLVLEAYLGGRIVDQGQDGLTAVHVPLAMALMALVVWLPLRARARD